MNYQKVYEVFERLLDDGKKLSSLLDKKLSDSEVLTLRALNTSNAMFQKELIAMVQQSFPDTSFEVRRWSEENRKSWLILLNKYPVFWEKKEEDLVGIFCGMNVMGELYQYRDFVVPILKHDSMIYFAATCDNESVVSGLYSLIEVLESFSASVQFARIFYI